MPKYIKKNCLFCKEEYNCIFKRRNTQKYCSRECVNKKQAGKGNPAYGKVYRTKETHPEWSDKIKSAHIERGSLTTENPMKDPKIVEKAKASRKKYLANPDNIKKIANKTKIAWEEGKFDEVAVGACKWYTYAHSNGKEYKVQGTWELAFIKWIDKQGLNFSCHKGRIPYIDKEGMSRNYYPDFYIEDWGCYVDIKNDYLYSISKDKFESIFESHKNIKILLKKDLLELGVL
jgi:hypothetical protein